MLANRIICFFIFLLGSSFLPLFAQPGQIAIPRIEQMPNQPVPYNVRDWKQVALRYDSFVYDINRSGQYLPLTFIQASGFNYPERPSFRQHTYVGTNSPFGNEAINVMPSIIGATLSGIDKSNQFGHNWVLMSQDFFNKNNGESIYLNAPNTSSGNDWWYDMMPNLYFYQLYDLYPDVGGEAQQQFTAVADRMLEAVRGMGGNDSPWSPAHMNYRAWRFRLHEPNPNGVPEPEAAGAYAWLLYHAWKQTGHAEYLKGAEWSMEFLQSWTTNPSYELQLPYGTYTAAKMNAELGTNYPIQKFVNWSFDRGPLRGWGTIVGTWGGFPVHGLVGEANDNGNDYAFQLNGVQQAAALVPMVRYDKRFARAIGKWMLNLTNATRLFYPGFLPANQQDASAWSVVNDPQQVMGYEALRQVWQGFSPFSTGDAVQGGWAATNLALYGTSSIGYLGAIVEKTNVDRILRLDLLATDFFRNQAYPSYLYYNSYNTPRQVLLDVGAGPVDIYEALTETFTHQSVSGVVTLTLPANAAASVVVCPANGTITYNKNKMLVNGVVVDYRQSAQPYQLAPRIKGMGSLHRPLEVEAQTTLYCTVEDYDSDQLFYEWSADAGQLDGESQSVVFSAPDVSGSVLIRCVVADPEGNRDTAFLQLDIVEEINLAPVISTIERSSAYTAPGEYITLNCLASDPNPGDTLGYQWSASAGSFSQQASSVVWTAPLNPGIYTVSVTVHDNRGLSTQSSIKVLVKVFTMGSGQVVAHYPFTGNAQDLSGNQLHGSVNGAILTPDRFGTAQRAYYFNGGNQHIAVSNHPLLNFQQGISVSCWFRAAALPDKETFILSHGSWQNRWKISITPDRKLRWTLNSTAGISDLDTDISLVQDSFYYVTATYDGSLLALYINGSLHSFKAFSGLIRTTTIPLLMGQMLPSDANYNFKGVLDDITIHNYALHPQTVLQTYNSMVTDLSTPGAAVYRLQVFPNPSTGVVHISLADSGELIRQLVVVDALGREVYRDNQLINSQLTLNMNAWPAGIYYLMAEGSTRPYVGRLLKQD